MKTKITQAEFNKKVEIESAFLTYMDRLPKEVADKHAQNFVSQKFEVKSK